MHVDSIEKTRCARENQAYFLAASLPHFLETSLFAYVGSPPLSRVVKDPVRFLNSIG